MNKVDPTLNAMERETPPEIPYLRGDQLYNSLQPSIAEPTGGTTQDTEARVAINSIIATLEKLGFIKPN